MKNTLVIFITKKELYALECVAGRKQYISMNGNQRMKLENEESVDAFCQYLLDEYSLNEFSELDQQVVLVDCDAENRLVNHLSNRIQESNRWEKYTLEKLLVLAVMQKKETEQEEYQVSFDKSNYRVSRDKVKVLEEEEKVQLPLSVEEICDAACFSIKEERWKGTDNTKLLAEKDATYEELKEKLEATLAGVNNEKEVLKKRVKQLIEENLELQKKLDEIHRNEEEKQKEKQRREERARREKMVFVPCRFTIVRNRELAFRSTELSALTTIFEKVGFNSDGYATIHVHPEEKVYFNRKPNYHGKLVTQEEQVATLCVGNYWAPTKQYDVPVSVSGRLFFDLQDKEEVVKANYSVIFAYVGPPEATQEDFEYFKANMRKEQ